MADTLSRPPWRRGRLAVVSQQIVTRDESADRWGATKSAMTTMPIVVVQPALEGPGQVRRAGAGWAVGPLVKLRAIDPLGLAVGARGVRAGASMEEVLGPGRGGEDARAVAAAVVGQHTLDAHAAPPKPRHRAAHKGGDAHPLLIREDFGVGHARAVIDTDMHELPADAARLAVAIPGDPMADVPDPAQFLDIEMQQLPGAKPFVAHDRGPLGEGPPAGQSKLHESAGDGGPTDLDALRNVRADPAQLAQALDLDHDRRGDRPGRAPGPTRPIRQLVQGRALDPFPGRPVTDAKGARDGCHGFSGVHPLGDQASTVGRGPGILVDVHSRALRGAMVRWATTTFAGRSRMDNLFRHHT